LPAVKPSAYGPGREREQFLDADLTPHQRTMWLAHELYPAVPLHNLASFFMLPVQIDVSHFRRAFQTLVDSSDALRTVIESVNGAPRQRVLPSMRRPVDHVDLSTAPDPDAAADAWIEARAGARFTLSECLYETALLKTGEARYVWFIHVHHAVSDGASVLLLARLLTQCYERSLAGTLPERLELPRFHDYVREALAFEGSPAAQRAKAYWGARLPAHPEPLLFYGETPRKSGTASVRISRTLTSTQMGRLEALAAGSSRLFARTTTLAAFAAVLATFLHRISGADRLCIGIPLHNRRTPALRDTLGLVMQVVPLAVRIDPGDTFLSFLKRIELDAMESWRYAQQTIPVSAREPIYDAVLNFHNPLDATIHGAPVRAVLMHPGHQLESLGIHVQDLARSGALTLDFDLHCEAFPPERRELVVAQYSRVLDAVLENPRVAIGDINLLSADEERRLLVDLNSAQLPLPEGLTYPTLFATQAERTPGAVAVVYEGRTLTYAELNARANQLARTLRSRGVAPETPVGVFMESSLDVAVAVLGILKAGGVYVPLDPTYPRERTAFMLRDADVRHLLTEGRLLPELPPYGGHVLCLDRDEWRSVGSGDDDPPDRLTPEHLAYIVYTSGATGTPKGVMLTHRNLCSRLLWGSRTFHTDHEESYLQNASWAYDAAVWALLEPWVGGGRCVLARSDRRSDPRYLVGLMMAAKVTFVAVSPTMLEMLLDAGAIESCRALRRVFAWGEPLPQELAARFLARSPAELYNVYGQTETCISATLWRCRAGAAGHRTPIGHPHANTDVYILDPARRPVPIGVPGELYVGGAGVARGYLNRPDLTGERFVPSPFDGADPVVIGARARLFRTGDLARFGPDGTIECLGRMDRQVKIRGNRVELGEIEAVLRRRQGVRDVAVVARLGAAPAPGHRAEPQLVAYYVSEAPIPARDLRSECRGVLPGFMVPSTFVSLDALPLTSSGKVDERRLPTPETRVQEEPDHIEPPRDPIEEVIARIFAEVLDLPSVSVDANFFDLGGDSLRGVHLIARVEEAFELEAPPRWLVEAPTVAGVAARVRQLRDARPAAPVPAAVAEAASPLVAIRRSGSKRPFFLVAGGAGADSELLVYASLAPYLDADQPFFGLPVKHLGGPGASFTVEELAGRLLEEVTGRQPSGPYLLGGECIGGIVAFEMAQQLRARGQDVALLALLDTVTRYSPPPSAGSLSWAINRFRGVVFRARVASAGTPLVARRHERRGRRTMYRRYLSAVAAYRPAPYDGPIDVVVNSRWHGKHATLGWDALARGRLRVHVVPGDHTSYIRRHVRAAAETLGACLRRAQESAGAG
jgi:amino acid adenylation domain-containing protein